MLNEGINNLEDDSTLLPIASPILNAITTMKVSPVQNLVTEWVLSARNRVQRNALGHPFGPNTPKSMRKDALKFYNKCLEHEFTKVRQLFWV